eukprot:Skav234684  [mRNA]  locus=scaffold3643:46047:46778:+ [translate_table: standard]
MLFFVLLGLWPLQASAGWSNGKGSSWHRHGQWYQGRSHGSYQSEGIGGTFNDAAALLASVLEKTAGRRQSRRDRSSSRSRSPSHHRKRSSRRSHSPSDKKELQELRLYKEQAEASKKAAQEEERRLQEKMRRDQELKDLEEKMMKFMPVHFRNPREGKRETREAGDNSEISRVGMKAIEWMLDKQVDMTDVSTWQGVEDKIAHLETQSLRDLYASKVSETNIPRSKAQRVNAIMDFLAREMKH